MKFLRLLLCLILTSSAIVAQELNCVVKVNDTQVEGSEKRVFKTLERAVFEFMNNRRWTSDVYKPEERIECSIFINVTERVSTDQFKATIQISARRPVYNSSYYSTTFNHFDEDFDFQYLEYAPLDFNVNSHMSDLTSVLGFYAYMIIGFDYDSYAMKGGTVHFQNAQKIVNNAQISGLNGWKAFDGDKTRYWMVENILNDFFAPLRECQYNYHRNGFDMLSQNIEQGRKQIIISLQKLEPIHNSRPSSFIMQVFFNAKSDEVVHLMSEALPAEQNNIKNLLTKIDPGNTSKYQNIGKNDR